MTRFRGPWASVTVVLITALLVWIPRPSGSSPSGTGLAPGPQLFATLGKPPIGVAVTSSRVLMTMFNQDKVRQIDSSGNVSDFAILPTTGRHVERYIAIATGVGCFPKDYVYATVGQTVYRITPDGSTVTKFVTLPSLPNGETGITFDTVGTFNYRMILTDRRGPVWTVDCRGRATQVADAGEQIEGPMVAALSFGRYAGDILVGNEFQDEILAIDPSGGVHIVASSESPEGLILVPPTVCNMGSSGGAYFVAIQGTNPDFKNQVYEFDASNFTGLNDNVLVPSELTTQINLLHADGSISTFWLPFAEPNLEGSAFAPCA